MPKADKKFHAERRYYRIPVETELEASANPSWPERHRKMNRAKQWRLWKILGLGLLMIGVVAGTFYLLSR